MRLKIILLHILFQICLKADSQPQNVLRKGYIKFEHLGNSSKPYPEIVFYLPNSIDTATQRFFTYKIELSEVQFDSVKKIIDQGGTELNTNSLIKRVAVTCVVNEEKRLFLFSDQYNLSRVVDKIITYFRDTPNLTSVKESMGKFLRNVGVFTPEYKPTFGRKPKKN